MHVFITGASGFIGLAVIKELIAAGHKVHGLARSDESARAVEKVGAEVHRGSLQDLDSLKSGAKNKDGVIHCAFNHDFSKFAENCEDDRRAIMALGETLVGTKSHLIVTSGTGFTQGRPRTEEDPPNPSTAQMPRKSEEAAAAVQAQGVRVSVVRLPQVHDPVKQGLVSYAIDIARKKGVAAYVNDGLNRWPAVHRAAAAKLYSLVLDKGITGSRYNAVCEEGVTSKEIAEAIGHGLKIPVVSKSSTEALEHFGWLAPFMEFDMPTSSALTQERLGWDPSGPGMIEDLYAMKML